jgi:uncharacterized protein YbjT (DUF2867 family)
VLVTGASGFAGSLLIPRLASEGHKVRALGRDPVRVREALARSRDGREGANAPQPAGVEVVHGDVLAGGGLDLALADVEVAYYLIHSMERSAAPAGSFAERERLAAKNFAAAADRAGVRRLVYLGGLLPRQAAQTATRRSRHNGLSAHLASREGVERILMRAVPEPVALRASIVIGARSRSFRLLVHLVERMPLLALPSWRRFRTQPIDARDVTEMLARAAAAPVPPGALNAGGPEVLSYGEMVSRIAELMLVRRPALGLRVSLTPLTARLAAAIAGEEPELVLPLMGSLSGDLLVTGEDAARHLGITLHSFDSAVEHALGEWERFEPLAAR